MDESMTSQMRFDGRPRARLAEGQRYDRGRARIRIGLDDGHEPRPAAHLPVLVLVPSEHQIDPGHARHEVRRRRGARDA
jgi:hypothetical protein